MFNNSLGSTLTGDVRKRGNIQYPLISLLSIILNSSTPVQQYSQWPMLAGIQKLSYCLMCCSVWSNSSSAAFTDARLLQEYKLRYNSQS